MTKTIEKTFSDAGKQTFKVVRVDKHGNVYGYDVKDPFRFEWFLGHSEEVLPN